MPIDENPLPYFDTPERAERLQLLIHLINNAQDVAYLRAPHGAGKTRFAQQLAEALANDYALVWLEGEEVFSVQGLLATEFQVEASQLNWPAGVSSLVEEELLIIADTADSLAPAALDELALLRDAGVRLLFVGNGTLQVSHFPWQVQYVDLPPFNEKQSLQFIAAAGVDPESLGGAVSRGLHLAAGGWPGHLVNALTAIPVPDQLAADPRPVSPKRTKPSPLVLIGAAALGVIVLVVLLLQNQINALFQPNDEPAQVESSLPAQPTEVDPLPIAQAEKPPVPSAVLPETPPRLEVTPPVTTPPPELATPAVPTAETPSPSPEPLPSPDVPNEVEAPATAETPIPRVNPDELLNAVIDAAIQAAEQPAVESPSVAQQTEPAPPKPEPKVQPLPAPPVVEKTPPPPPKSTLKSVRPPVASSSDRLETDRQWINAASPPHFTLQLAGARDLKALEQFLSTHQFATPHAVFVRQLDGQPWYSLILGDYADRDAAVAAREALPADLRDSGVWPRTFESVQSQMDR